MVQLRLLLLLLLHLHLLLHLRAPLPLHLLCRFLLPPPLNHPFTLSNGEEEEASDENKLSKNPDSFAAVGSTWACLLEENNLPKNPGAFGAIGAIGAIGFGGGIAGNRGGSYHDWVISDESCACASAAVTGAAAITGAAGAAAVAVAAVAAVAVAAVAS